MFFYVSHCVLKAESFKRPVIMYYMRTENKYIVSIGNIDTFTMIFEDNMFSIAVSKNY